MVIEEMNKMQVEAMLAERAQLALDTSRLDKQYPDVFCGVTLDVARTIHIYKPCNLKKIAEILGKKVVIKPYSKDEILGSRYLGKMWFVFEYAGLKWNVFALYENESEVVG